MAALARYDEYVVRIGLRTEGASPNEKSTETCVVPFLQPFGMSPLVTPSRLRRLPRRGCG